MICLAATMAQTPNAAGDLPAAAAWTASEMLAAEKKAVGFYVTGHPWRLISTWSPNSVR